MARTTQQLSILLYFKISMIYEFKCDFSAICTKFFSFTFIFIKSFTAFLVPIADFHLGKFRKLQSNFGVNFDETCTAFQQSNFLIKSLFQ